MRNFLIIAVLATTSSAGLAAADYYLKIEGVSRTSAAGPIYLKVAAIGDLDGDGVPDDAIVRLNCVGGQVQSAHLRYNVKSPRDSASGQASGKRTHHPVTFIKEWGPSTPQLYQLRVGYDLKKQEGAGFTTDGWQMLSLANADGLCPAAAAAAKVKATKSRSNIQNN